MYNDKFMSEREPLGNSYLRQILEGSERGQRSCCDQHEDGCCEHAHEHEASCQYDGCGAATAANRWGLSCYPLASVYSPLQEFRDIYDIDTALGEGTIFKELNLPFLGGKSGCGCGTSICGGGRNG